MREREGSVVRVIEESYFQVPARLAAAIDLALNGAESQQVANELARAVRRPSLTPEEALLVLKRVFGPFDFDVILCDRGSSTGYQFVRQRTGSALDSIKLKFTVLPGAIADYFASHMSFMHKPVLVTAVCISAFVSMTIYVNAFGWSGLGITFAVVHQGLLSTDELLLQIAIMLLSYFAHEMGHCSASARFGRKVKRIGFGIYWIFPALFSDVTTSWELNRKQRMTVDAGGIYFQVAICSALATASVMFATSDIVHVLQICLIMNLFSILASLNPMMKFDGYWLYADWFDIKNLRSKSVDFLKHFIRRLLLMEKEGYSGVGWALPVYSVASVAYGVLFAWYVASAVTKAASYAVGTSQHAVHQILEQITVGDYLGALTSGSTMVVSLVPLLFFPIVVVSAFSGVANFAGQLGGKYLKGNTPVRNP